MTEQELSGARHVPSRMIPVPRHVSPEAQAMLAMTASQDAFAYPALDDIPGWRQRITAGDAMISQMMGAETAGVEVDVRELYEGAARAFEIVPKGISASDRRVYLDIHGGALIMGAGEVCRIMGIRMASKLGTKVVSVDYRMPPDHPYPAGLDDCVAFYRVLLRNHRPEEIIVGGLSAGGCLAGALMLKARDDGLPLPAAAVLLSPEIDLTESGDSFQTNLGIDDMGSLMAANLLYAGGHDLAHPYLSPLFGDFSKGFPPTLLIAGTRDLFLSNAVRMHRALRNAGVAAELQIQEAATHAALGAWPESADIDREVRVFCEARWNDS